MKKCFFTVVICLFLTNILYAIPNNEIKLLIHADGTGTPFDDTSQSNHNITPNNGVTESTIQSKFGGCSGYFDGINGYLSAPDSADWDFFGNNSDNWTIGFFVRRNIVGSDGFYMGQYTDSNHYWRLFDNGPAEGLKLYIYNNSVTLELFGSGGYINNTVWHHIAICKVANKYGLYVDGVKIGNTTNSNTCTFSGTLTLGAVNGGAYTLDGNMDEICVSNSNLFGVDPASGNGFTPPAQPFDSLIQPQNPSATAGTAQIILNWDDVPGATGYTVKYDTVSGGSAYSTTVTNSDAIITGLTNGTLYYFRIIPFDNISTGNFPSSEVSATPTLPGPPVAPVLNLPSAGNTSVTLSWNAVSTASGYKLKWDATNNGVYDNTQDVGNQTSFTVSGLNNDTTYFFVVSAYNAMGDGNNSNMVSAAPTAGGTLWSQNGNNIYYSLGNVGIGTNVPLTPLDVNGMITANGITVDSTSGMTIKTGSTEIGKVNFSDSEVSGYIEYNHASNNMSLGTSGVNAVEVNSSQDVNFTGNVNISGNLTVDGIFPSPPTPTLFVPKGYIRGANPKYHSLTAIKITPGNGECNGNYFEFDNEIYYQITFTHM
ncbi:MAG: beta-1,3-glucanase [uncultured bacterium]|nr:MAG: beta-1,3-glucanase [uncultured bacterium]